MSKAQINDGFPKEFYSSSKSQVGKSRRWLWLAWLIGLVMVVVPFWDSPVAMYSGVVIVLLLAVLVDRALRSQLKPGKPVITIDHEGIKSANLSDKNKHIYWADIIGVSIESLQNNHVLKFQLTDTPLHSNRSSLLGANPAEPFLPLGVFSEEDKEMLFLTLNQRLQQFRSVDGGGHAVVNTAAEERAFHEELEAMMPVAWLTYGLIAINVLIWVAAIVQGESITQTSVEKLFLWGGNAASEVQAGEWWRLLTATFLHGGLMHLAMNMVGLISVGVLVERIYGHRQYALIYFGSGLIGSGLSLHFSAQTAVSVGASGAVFGIVGALLTGILQHRDRIPSSFSKNMIINLSLFIGYSLFQGFAKPGIDNAAHVGGLLGGMVLAYLLSERFDMEHFIANWKKRVVMGLVLVAVLTVGLTMTSPMAAVNFGKTFESQAALVRSAKQFDIAIKAFQKEQADIQSGKISEREADDRSRAVLAPLFKKAQQDFDLVELSPSDGRYTFFVEIKRMNELLLESLEMESVYKEGSDKPESVNPQRMEEINEELKVVIARIQKIKNKQAKK